MNKAMKKVHAEETFFLDIEEPISRPMVSSKIPPRGFYRLLYIEGGDPMWVTKDYKEVPKEWTETLDNSYFHE